MVKLKPFVHAAHERCTMKLLPTLAHIRLNYERFLTFMKHLNANPFRKSQSGLGKLRHISKYENPMYN